jgi:glutathione S-transferase kappa 1
LAYIKAYYDEPRFFSAVIACSKRLWEPPNLDIADPEKLRSALATIFSNAELDDILAGATAAETKKMLTTNSENALEKGAYGAPWFWVTNSAGVSEPFFGSDRFHFMWQYLDLPFQNFELLDKNETLETKGSKL